ncbi:hypothetical protein BGZ63DRAFT_104588 [Mariannaea sp. PMI_226]|nr:hypothetical protein BGZ63DRAFT_104588 [Mariannaea sp. PMI_226]
MAPNQLKSTNQKALFPTVSLPHHFSCIIVPIPDPVHLQSSRPSVSLSGFFFLLDSHSPFFFFFFYPFKSLFFLSFSIVSLTETNKPCLVSCVLYPVSLLLLAFFLRILVCQKPPSSTPILLTNT